MKLDGGARFRLRFAVLIFAFCFLPITAFAQAKKPTSNRPATLAEAERFIADAEKRLLDLSIKAERANWVNSTYITDDTEAIAADAQEVYTAAVTQLAEQSRRFDRLKLPYDLERKFMLLKLALTLPAPTNPEERERLTKITVMMQGEYGKGKYCPDGEKGKCLSLNDMARIMAESRDPEELKKIWLGWHSIAPPFRDEYQQFVELANKGAREMGFKDLGAMWRSNYDMPPDAFASEMERLWLQVKPLYDSLYTYTRAQLVKKYGSRVVPADGLVPAHLFGNMWSQDWTNIYPLLKPKTGDPGYDLTEILQKKQTDEKQIVRYGEQFYTSLGFERLPETFWERSLFKKPADHEVVRHASALSLDY